MGCQNEVYQVVNLPNTSMVGCCSRQLVGVESVGKCGSLESGSLEVKTPIQLNKNVQRSGNALVKISPNFLGIFSIQREVYPLTAVVGSRVKLFSNREETRIASP